MSSGDSAHGQLEVDVDKEYMIGLLDYLAKPRLELQSRTRGYSISSRQIVIPVRQSELLCGLITRYLESNNINFNVEFIDDKPRHIIIQRKASIDEFRDWGSGQFLQIADRLAYLAHITAKYHGESLANRPDVFLKIFKPWADLHPEWESQEARKYTLDFLQSELGIDSISETEEIPDVSYPDKVSPEYVSGLFDAAGNIDLHISEASDTNIQYSMSPIIRIQITNPRTLVGPHLKKFFADTDINPSFSQQSRSLRITITNADAVDEFLDLISPHTYYHYDSCKLFYEQILPAYRDGYHRSKQGFMDILRTYEEVIGRGSRAKYDVEYFEEQWDLD